MPLAPPRVSTITVWRSDSCILVETSRASMSMVGPGGVDTTMVIGLAVGQLCASAAVAGMTAPNANRSAAAARHAFIFKSLSSSLFRLDAGGADHLGPLVDFA